MKTYKGTFIHKRKSVAMQIVNAALDQGLRVKYSEENSCYKVVVS